MISKPVGKFRVGRYWAKRAKRFGTAKHLKKLPSENIGLTVWSGLTGLTQ